MKFQNSILLKFNKNEREKKRRLEREHMNKYIYSKFEIKYKRVDLILFHFNFLLLL